MYGKAIINRINLGRSEIAILTRINGNAIINRIYLCRSAIAMMTRI